MVLGPKHADPTQNGTARGWLSHVDQEPIGSLDASFQACIREFKDGNYDVIELELGSVALTVLLVAHGHRVLGHETVLHGVGAGAMAAIRAEAWLLDAGREAMAATQEMIRRGLLDWLKTPAEVIPAYRRNIDDMAALLAMQEVTA